MELSYDPNKEASNLEKHGIRLSDARAIDWATLLIGLDDRMDYGEDRYIGLGYIGMRLYCVAFSYRDETVRVISLRKANKREQTYYEQCH